MKSDTIAAIATAMTNSGIGKIRISGPDAISVISKIYRSKYGNKDITLVSTHTVHYGYIMDGNELIDEVIVIIMKAPNTYTREDIVEIDCHGGVLVMKKILNVVLKYGAGLAEPGEFTKRAFLNGRIDLSQAEAVIDLINSKNEYARQSSLSQLKGIVFDKIKNIRSSILHQIAFIESALDDPEHVSIDGYSEKLLKVILDIKDEITYLLESSENGKVIKEGINTVIVGKPNAGKSSLLNVLLGEDRAIVTDIAGTTRDALEATINLGGINLNIVDTAGIRETSDIVEQIGVSKAKEYLLNCDLIIYVVDSSTPLDENDYRIIELIKDKNAIVLLNKSDLEVITTEAEIIDSLDKKVISISAKESIGINLLEDHLKTMFYHGNLSFNDEIYITNIRHKKSLEESLKSICMVESSIRDEMPEDFFSIDLMNAYTVLGEIIGESVEDDLVNEIFSKFCMGK